MRRASARRGDALPAARAYERRVPSSRDPARSARVRRALDLAAAEGAVRVNVDGTVTTPPLDERGLDTTASVDCGSGRPANGTPREALPQCAATVPPKTSRGTASYCMKIGRAHV